MKTRTAPLLLAALLSVLPSLPMSAASPAAPAVSYSVEKATLPNNNEIRLGTTQFTARRLMGPAARELSPTVWAYQGHRANLEQANDQGCNTLIITFVAGKVADLSLVNDRAVAVIAANLEPKPATRQVAAK